LVTAVIKRPFGLLAVALAGFAFGLAALADRARRAGAFADGAAFLAGLLAFLADRVAAFIGGRFAVFFATFLAAGLPAGFFLAVFAGFLRAMSNPFPESLSSSVRVLDSLALSNVISIGYAERG
jgi:hypothetical protein